MEQQSVWGNIDLFYGDESRVCEQGYVPYGWQFKGEEVFTEVAKGRGLNCFALLSRNNKLIYRTTEQSIDAGFIMEQLEDLSLTIQKQTVVVLDNASVHSARRIKQCIQAWQQRGLYIFYLPPYSPHLNITERLWKELKARWLRPQDYRTADSLFYQTKLILQAVGKNLHINFSTFKNLNTN